MKLHLDWKSLLKTPNIAIISTKLTLLSLFVIIVFFQDFLQVFNLALTNAEIQYIIIVPIVAGFFFFKSRRAFQFDRQNSILTDITAAATCLLALIIYIYGSYSLFPVEIHLITLPIFFAGITLLFFGKDTLRSLIFPISLLIFLSPFPIFFSDKYGAYFIDSATTVSASILRLFLPIQYALRPDAIISLVANTGQAITFEVAPACSGIYSLISMAFFCVIFLYIVSGSWIKKTLFALLAVLTAFLLNVLRIVLTVTLGYQFGYGIGVEFFHDFGGVVLLFFGSLLLIVAGDKLLKLSFLKTGAPNCIHKTENSICKLCGKIFAFPKKTFNWKRLGIIVLFLLITTALFLQASATTYDRASNDKNNSIGLNINNGQTSAFAGLTNYTTQYLGRETSAEERLGLYYVGDYLLYSNGSQINAILEVSDAQSKFHTWEGCLNYQNTPMNIQKTTVLTLYDQQNTIVTAESMIADIPAYGQKLVLLYWFDSANLKINDTSSPWALKLTLYQTISNTTDPTESTNNLISLGTQIENSWSQYKNPASGFSVDIYRNITPIFSVILVLLIGPLILLYTQNLLTKKGLKTKLATLQPTEIQQLESLSNKNPQEDRQNINLEQIEQLKNSGFIKESTVLIDGQPYLKWKNQTYPSDKPAKS